MSKEYEKIAYVWNEPKEKVVVPDRCTFIKVSQDLENSFKKVISQVVVNSLEDKKHIISRRSITL